MWIEKHRDVWRIRETIPGNPPSKLTLASGYLTKSAAKDAMVILKSEQLLGTGLVPRGGEKLVADLCKEWWDETGDTYTRIRSNESISGVMDRYIVRLLGVFKLRELEENPGIVQRWVNDLSAGRTRPLRGVPRKLKPKTVRNAHGLLHQIMGVAVKAKLIRNNPCADTRLPDEEETEMYFLTPAEADRLIAALPVYWRPLVLFLLATGCRWSEAMGLRAKNLDVLGRKVLIVKKTVMDSHGVFHDEDPKSKRGRRTISFTARVAGVLIPLAMLDEDRERRIFLTPRGKMIRAKEFYVIWNKACDDAGLKGLRVHDIRHTHVCWLISAKVPLSAISRRLGHKNISVTDDEYGHLLEEVFEHIVASLEEAMLVIDMGGIWGETDADQPQLTAVNDG